MSEPAPAAAAPDIMGFSHERSLVVEWGHCDPAGIVFNPRFFEFFDWSTALLLEAATGVPKAAMLERFGLRGIPLVATEASFRRPARYGDLLTVRSTVVEVGRTSFVVRHEARLGEAVAVLGRERRVWAGPHPDDPAGLKALPIPADLARVLRGDAGAGPLPDSF
ncbi:MAG: acyl-CoA thioesterase [Methylobacteriaceae bacterium]|nr:acyl-CoA thioesterase [Methylobacteriaceae bacterium]